MRQAAPSRSSVAVDVPHPPASDSFQDLVVSDCFAYHAVTVSFSSDDGQDSMRPETGRVKSGFAAINGPSQPHEPFFLFGVLYVER